MKKQLAPLIIFTYKRADTLSTLIDSLLKNELVSETYLYIFSDGPKNESDVEPINAVRSFIKTIKGFKNIECFYAETNKGLATSIISGVSKILERYPNAIVLEDDLIVTPNFLNFMNHALNIYQDDEKAFSISGYSFNLGIAVSPGQDAYFLNRGWSWGWATWKNRWENIDWLVSDYKEFANSFNLKQNFNKGGSDLTSMLKKQMTNRLDSWAIRWFYAQFKVGGLTLYPVKSKIFNNGFDSRATHTTGASDRYIPHIDTSLSKEFVLPEKVEIDQQFQKAFRYKMGISARIKSKVKSIIVNLSRKTKKS